ncbi:MAG TPA: hypothetical protein VNY84_12525 [Acidimicrobiales bacterium]|nr:hypothetical protein [Acidimicrobiales bacterium]
MASKWQVMVACALAMVGGVGPQAGAGAQTPSAAIGFLLMSPQPVRDHGTVTVKPSDPCVPPSAATQPIVLVTDTGSDAAPAPRRLASVPVGPDGLWSTSVTLDGSGEHALQAYCMSGPQAEGAYAFYEPTFIDVVARSAGFWAASRARGAPAPAGDAPDYGSGLSEAPAAPVVGVAPDPTSGIGYWTVSSDGGVYTFGHSAFYGSAGDVHLAAPAVGMAVTPTGRGYWIAAADGGVFTYGDALFRGSGLNGPDHSPVVGIARLGTPSAPGYLLAHADGAVFAYGLTGARADNGPLRLDAPVVGIATTPSGQGYWLTAADGGVFAFGDATFAGSLGAVKLNAPVTGIASRFGGGYWLIGRDGGVFSFGGAPFLGSFAAKGLRFSAIASTPDPVATAT